MEKLDLFETPIDDKLIEVGKFINRMQENFIAFGELLSHLKRTNAFKAKNYSSFKEFIEKEFNLSAAFASRLISTYELFMEERGYDDKSIIEIGFDRLNMIRPIVKSCDNVTAEEWIEEARNLSTPDLREKIKDEKEKTKKPETIKDIMIKQYREKMTAFLKCNGKELEFLVAVYFQDEDLKQVKSHINEKLLRYNLEDNTKKR